MQLAMASHALGMQPIDEDIRIAAVSGFPWLVMDHEKLESYLATPEFDIRDLKRIFLRTQPAAIDGVTLPGTGPDQLDRVEALCREARRVGAPVVVLRVEQPDDKITALADVAQKWSTVLALAPAMDGGAPSFSAIREIVRRADRPNLGWLVDTLALWQAGERLTPDDAPRAVLLAVGDLSSDGKPALPGEGVIPLKEILSPLFTGGYDSIAVLMSRMAEARPRLEQWSQAAYRALESVMTEVGWTVEG